MAFITSAATAAASLQSPARVACGCSSFACACATVSPERDSVFYTPAPRPTPRRNPMEADNLPISRALGFGDDASSDDDDFLSADSADAVRTKVDDVVEVSSDDDRATVSVSTSTPPSLVTSSLPTLPPSRASEEDTPPVRRSVVRKRASAAPSAFNNSFNDDGVPGSPLSKVTSPTSRRKQASPRARAAACEYSSSSDDDSYESSFIDDESVSHAGDSDWSPGSVKDSDDGSTPEATTSGSESDQESVASADVGPPLSPKSALKSELKELTTDAAEAWTLPRAKPTSRLRRRARIPVFNLDSDDDDDDDNSANDSRTPRASKSNFIDLTSDGDEPAPPSAEEMANIDAMTGDLAGMKVTERVTEKKTETSPVKQEPSNAETSVDEISEELANVQVCGKMPEWLRQLRGRSLQKEGVAERLFSEFDDAVLDGALKGRVTIQWNKRLAKTAGTCELRRRGKGDEEFRTSRINLSTKVLDTAERLYSTLAHEMCHAAAWIVDGIIKPPHGKDFKLWASRFREYDESLLITTCHSYDITYKYTFRCSKEGCNNTWGRHSKSIDVDKMRCPCGGRIRLDPLKKAKR